MKLALSSPRERFIGQVLTNPFNSEILKRLPDLELEDSWLVAGCLFQTVWNLKGNLPATSHIRDYDVFYFDAADLTEESELAVQRRASVLYADLGVTIEIKNQARVHLWYEDWFGHSYKSLKSSRDGIDRFLVLSTCVGLQRDAEGGYELHAPNGFDDLEAGVLKPNPKTDHPELFRAKAQSYRERWPWLRLG